MIIQFYIKSMERKEEKKMDEIVYECKSINNKNVRANELNILEKYEDRLYFEFGENPKNTKKRYYENVETLREDFEALQKIKKEVETAKEEQEEFFEEVEKEKSIEPEEELLTKSISKKRKQIKSSDF